MITFTKFCKYGRLGNQLFQAAAMIGIAKKTNHKLLLPRWAYAKYFNWKIEEGHITSNHEIKEPQYNFNEVKLPEKGIFDFLGYYQSEKYWIDSVDEVKSNLSFNDDFVKQVKTKYINILHNNPIAISIRRGDYVNNPNYELLPIQYYLTALLHNFPDWQSRNIIIFSDDVEYCSAHFGCFDNIFIAQNTFNNTDKRLYFSENSSAIEQLCLMSLCNDFIISNSTFAWWGAYLGQKEKSKVIYPHVYAKGKLKESIDFKDHYPENWIKFDFTNKRIDLSDVTFMIPVHYDHNDRMQNLSLNVCMLMQCFNTNIIIGEQGSDKFGIFNNWAQYIKFNDQTFHRTKMLNIMARESKTSIIVNYDADVFLPPMQVLKSIFDLKKNDVVYPYDGRFARVSRKEFRNLETFLDVGCVAHTEWPGTRQGDLPSVGGCVFFNKKAYFEGGGENEKFVSYGPEDTERMERFSKAGFKVSRVKGIIYHLDHFRGPNSLTMHKYFKANENEFNRIKAMNKEEIINYIKQMQYAK